MPAMMDRSSLLSYSGGIALSSPPQICKNGFWHDAVTSRSSNSIHEFAGSPKSEYSMLAVI